MTKPSLSAVRDPNPSKTSPCSRCQHPEFIVEVAILSEVGEPDLHSVRDNRDAHTRAEVVEALSKAGRPYDEQSKFRTRTVDVPNQVPHRNEPSFPMTRSRRLSGIEPGGSSAGGTPVNTANSQVATIEATSEAVPSD